MADETVIKWPFGGAIEEKDTTVEAEETVAGSQLRAFVERIERLNEELTSINDDKKEVFAEAKGFGFDTKALKHVVKLRSQDKAQRQEFEAIVELYMNALGES